MKPLISIVIPAYNVEKYISKCIQSINEQTFSDYEVVIVDDGSTDRTLEVINENITSKYKVFSQKNLGAGEARNKGISLVNGKYITFMDSDDFLYDNSCLEKIAKVIQKSDFDVITYKMVRYYQDSNRFLIEDDITPKDKKFNKVYDYLKATIETSRLSISPCDKIIKTKIIKDNNIYFEKMAMLEDIDWSLKLYKYVKNIMVYNEPIYVYRQGRVGSTTNSYNHRKISACIDFVLRWTDICKKNNDEYSKLYLHYIAYQYTILLAAVSRKNSTMKDIKKLKEYSWLLKYDLNFKTKKANKIYMVFGYNMMIKVLKIYLYLKNKNLILIRK